MLTPKHCRKMAKSNKTESFGYVIRQTVKKVAVPLGKNLEAAPCKIIPIPFASPAKRIISVPRNMESVRNAYGKTKIPDPMMVFTVLITLESGVAPLF